MLGTFSLFYMNSSISMVSQSGALLGLVAVAALHVQKDKTPGRDLHFEQTILQMDQQIKNNSNK